MSPGCSVRSFSRSLVRFSVLKFKHPDFRHFAVELAKHQNLRRLRAVLKTTGQQNGLDRRQFFAHFKLARLRTSPATTTYGF